MSAVTSQRRPVTYLIPEGVALTIAYLMGHGLMFLNKGIYWDDWAWYRQPWAVLADVSRQLGSLWPAWTMAAPYHSEFSVWATRGIAATCYLLASLWFLGILRHLGVDRGTRLLMAMSFALFPVNGARIPIATAAYGASLALFVGGFRLVIASVERPSIWLRGAAALSLLLSLRTASFGVLLPLVFAYLIWHEGAVREPGRWLSVILRHAELMLVPIIYLLLRATVLVPSGIYSDYNVITRASAVQGLVSVPAGVWHSLIAPLAWGVGELAGAGGLVAALAVFVLLYLSSGREQDAVMSRRVAAIWVGAGLTLAFLALLPYLLVGKMPALTDFESRHQLLIPFGAALIFGGGLRLVFGSSDRYLVPMLAIAALLFGGFAAADAANNLSYLRERYKHIAMMEAMRVQPGFRSATTFTFADDTQTLNANRRTSVREYEYVGMMFETFGDQTRFGADASEFARVGMSGFRSRFTSLYKMGGYVERPVQYQVDVANGPLGIDRNSTVLRLLVVDILSPSQLPSATAGAVLLRLKPATAGG